MTQKPRRVEAAQKACAAKRWAGGSAQECWEAALDAADAAAWRSMVMAPRDGTLVDIWCRRTASRPLGPAGRVPKCRWNARDGSWGYQYTAGNPDEFWVLDGELVAWRPLPPAPGETGE